MIDLTQIARHTLQTQPFAWAEIGNLYSPENAAALAATYPRDHFKTVVGYGGEKDYEYEARELCPMGELSVSHAAELSEAWISLAHDLLSPAYRAAMSLLTGRDLTIVPMEINVFHYGPRACLGAHTDLPDKLVTHVLYFNQSWDRTQGGCLNILRSANPSDVAAEIEPLVGNSAVLVRSDDSWHAVSRVVDECRLSRRSMTVTFYQHGSISSMWPPGDTTPLHQYEVADSELDARPTNLLARWRRKFTS